MLTEICGYLHNWFDIDEYHAKLPRLEGTYTISGGKLTALEELLIDGQCFYIYGSYLNDGVHVYTNKLTLNDETFTGLIQSMRVPPDVIAISEEAQALKDKYCGPDSMVMGPFQSESFGGYSYSKSSGASGANNGGGSSSSLDYPLSQFEGRLKRFKKL